MVFLFGNAKAQPFLLPKEIEKIYLILDESPKQALTTCDSILASPSHLSETDKAHLHIIRSDAYYYLEDIYKSSEAMQQAIQLMPFDFPILKKIEAYNSFGQNLASLGNPDSAIMIYKEGMEYAKKAKDSIQISNLYFNIGIEYKTKSKFDKALTYLDSSYQITLLTKDSVSISHSLRAIGYLNEFYYDFQAAQKAYRKALSYTNIKDPPMRCVTLTSLGNLFYHQDKLDSCYFYIQEAENCYRTLSDQNTIVYLYKLKSKYFIATKDTVQAIQMLDSVITKSVQVGDYEEYLGGTFLRVSIDSNYSKKINLEKLIREAEKRKMQEQLSLGYKFYVQELKRQGRYKKALFYQEKAMELKYDLMKARNQKLVKSQLVRFEVKEKENQIKVLKLSNELQEQENEAKLARWVSIFSVVLALLVGGFLFFLYQSKKTRLAAKEKQLRQLSEAQSAAFRAQMNPHFIFNSLNSIKGLIIKEENRKAAIYISKFSKLVRLVLENSQRKVVSLKEELETLELYILLEKLRFRDEFEHSIFIEGGLKTENIIIPPILIQPFVENSIWHGFRNNPRKNELTIQITEKNQNLLVSIEDNGVGRQSNQDKELTKNHTSYGIEITRKRIEFFSKNKCDFEPLKFIDLKDEEQNPIGTRVELKLPLKNKGE